MQPHEERVVEERGELSEKIVSLVSFTASSPVFALTDRIDGFMA